MTRIDLIVLKRVMSRVAVTIVIFFGLALLIESLDTPRYDYLRSIGGLPLSLTAMTAATAGWMIRGMPVTILVGAMIAISDLQQRRELVAIKSSGASIWRVIRAPAIALLLVGLSVTFCIDAVVTQTNRQIEATLPGDSSAFAPSGGLWLEQYANAERYVLVAAHVVGTRCSLGFQCLLRLLGTPTPIHRHPVEGLTVTAIRYQRMLHSAQPKKQPTSSPQFSNSSSEINKR